MDVSTKWMCPCVTKPGVILNGISGGTCVLVVAVMGNKI